MKKILTLLLVLFCVCSANAQEELVEVTFFNNTGGLNSKSSPLALRDNESSDCQNVFFDTDGAIIKRNGSVQLNTEHVTGATEHTVSGLYQFIDTSGSKFLVATIGDQVYKMDALDGTFDHITGATYIPLLTSGELNDFETLQDYVIATDGDDLPWKWDGATSEIEALDIPSGLTDAKWVKAFRNYLFLGNVVVSSVSHPSRVYYSAVGDITSWSSLDFIDIGTNDGQTITGLEVLGERLVVFKDRSIYNILFTGQSDSPFYVQKSDSEVGCASGYSVVKVRNNLVFLSTSGIYIYDGVRSTKISERIEPTLQSYNFSRYDQAVGANYETRSQYWLSFSDSGSTENDKVIIWDYHHNAFCPYEGLAIASLAVVEPASGSDRIYSGGYRGDVDRQDSGTSDGGTSATNGSAIDAYYWTKWLSFDSLAYQKDVDHLYFVADASGNHNLTVDYTYDLDLSGSFKTQAFSLYQGGATVGTAIVGTDVVAGTSKLIRRVDLTGQGRFIRFKFTNPNANEEFQIDGFSLIGKRGSLWGGTP